MPFGIGDGLSTGRGSQERRLLYYATIHGHPVVGGYIGRMPPEVAQAYDAMPVVGNLLRLSNGEDAVRGRRAQSCRFDISCSTRHGVGGAARLHAATLDMDVIASGDGKQLYAVQGATPRARHSIAIIVARRFELRATHIW